MAKKKWIDKKSAVHFTLVHRPQNDPLIHDESAPSMVLKPTQAPNASGSSVATTSEISDDLASKYGVEGRRRANEGEAAEHGVYFDDTEYDYMQHLRDLGENPGEAVWVDARPINNQNKGREKQSLEDALRQMNLEDKSEALLDSEILPSKNLQRTNYQDQQDVPDAIAGFQPDMDPRLREILEALEDDAYVDDDDDGFFKELAKDAQEVRQVEWETQQDFEDDGWESDATAKPNESVDDEAPQLVSTTDSNTMSETWIDEFKQFKKDQRKKGHSPSPQPSGASEIDGLGSLVSFGTQVGRKKKRKGAMTDPSNYSMTSSSLHRTDQQRLLDDRFEVLNAKFNDFDEGSRASNMSTVQGKPRQDFNTLLDEFLEETQPRGRSKKGKGGNKGVKELDQIRKDLGPARITQKKYSHDD